MRVCRHGSEETICLHVINYVIICNILSKQHVDIMFIVDGVSWQLIRKHYYKTD